MQRELDRRQREVDNVKNVSERWNAELKAWAVTAAEYGLISHTVDDGLTREQLLSLLQEAAAAVESAPTPQGIDEAVNELVRLQQEESRVSRTLLALRNRLGEMSKLKDNASSLKDALGTQRDRLSITEWLRALHSDGACPVCDSPLVGEPGQMEELLSALQDVQASIKDISRIPASFDREMLKVRQEMFLAVESVAAIGIRKKEVEARSRSANELVTRGEEIARFKGRLDRALEVQATIGAEGELRSVIDDLKRRLETVSKRVSLAGIESAKNRALGRVTAYASRIIPTLDSERPDDPIELLPNDLTIRVKGKDREDYLSEIGSGANWLAYHIAVSLSLHKLFMEDARNPVPNFLVYDQPSQVYFPRRLARPKEEEADPKLRDEDTDAVRKVFAALATATAEAKGKLQVIVLDHAASNVWGDVPGVHAVEEWRNDKKLVPMAWLS